MQRVKTYVFLFLDFLLQHANDADGDMDTMENMVVDAALSEAVNGILERDEEYIDRDENMRKSHSEDASHSEDVDGGDDEFKHAGEVSVGKKQWTFLTT